MNRKLDELSGSDRPPTKSTDSHMAAYKVDEHRQVLSQRSNHVSATSLGGTPLSASCALSHVGIDEWTMGRTPLTLSTNGGAQPLAFQRWRRFKEGFAPELVARAVSDTSIAFGRPVRTCIDPFAGSGTTPLVCQFLGVVPTAIEVNPYLADLVESKLTPIDGQRVAMRLAEVLATSRTVDPVHYYSGAPATFVEPGANGRYLFSSEIAGRLASLLEAVLCVPEDPVRRLLRVLLGTAALDVCNATVSGKGRRYRRKWRERLLKPSDLDRQFTATVEAAVFDATRFARRQTLAFDLIRGDACRELLSLGETDLAVFSPPYPNSFDYTDVYNIELWSLGYLRSQEENSELRRSTLRSHVQIKREMPSSAHIELVAKTIEQLRSVPKLWNPALPDMIGAYFADLRLVLEELRRMLACNGRVYMVVGDSRYSGVNIPVIEGLARMAPGLGYGIVGVEPFRSMRASPQQGGRQELAEALITLGAN